MVGTVLSHLVYANSLLICSPKCTTQSTQSIQNISATLMLGESRFDSSTEALRELY